MDENTNYAMLRTVYTTSSELQSVSSCRTGDYVLPEAVHNFTRQTDTDKRDMQELNEKLSDYIRKNKALDDKHQQLRDELERLKLNWGLDTSSIKKKYDPILDDLRRQIDDVSTNKAFAELAAKRAENDAQSTKYMIDFTNRLSTLEDNRLKRLLQLLERLEAELTSMERRFRDKGEELRRNQKETDLLRGSLEEKKNEYDEETKARIVAQHQFQTIEDKISFLKAIYEEERNALNAIADLPLSDPHFYDTQLTHTINLIRNDFEKLFQERRNQLDAYYTYKKDAFLAEVEKRKRDQEAEARNRDPGTTVDIVAVTTALSEERQSWEQLQIDDADMTGKAQRLESDLEEFTREFQRRQQKRERDLNDLCADIQKREQDIAAIVDNNVSLQSEINTYRRLLELEPDIPQMSSIQQQPAVQPGRKQDRETTEYETMTVQKSAKGPVAIDQVDLEGTFITLTNVGPTSADQDLTGWILRRAVDRQPAMIFAFPEDFVLRAGRRVRILARDANKRGSIQDDVLYADHVESWGSGSVGDTRLINDEGEERASHIQRLVQGN